LINIKTDVHHLLRVLTNIEKSYVFNKSIILTPTNK